MFIAFKLYNNYFHRDDKEYNLQLSTTIEIRLFDLSSFIDPRVARFILESANGNYEDSFVSHYIDFYKIHDRRYHLNINHKID